MKHVQQPISCGPKHDCWAI